MLTWAIPSPPLSKAPTHTDDAAAWKLATQADHRAIIASDVLNEARITGRRRQRKRGQLQQGRGGEAFHRVLDQ